MGIEISDGRKVIIKCAASENPSLEELAELRYEFSVLRRLAAAGAHVARPLEMVRYGHSEALVLEPATGRELSEIIAEGAVAPVRFCQVAIALAGCLDSVHAAGIIHRDVKPSHFFVDEGAGSATLIDFGLAADSRERTRSTRAERLAGTLAYIPPEQTGRVNRSVDRRSDLYSLGVTLYELSTGQRPFRGDDALDLIHGHLARTPASPSQLRPRLPAVLSDVVMRLLQKVPEHRYQTATGLRADLARALSQLVEMGTAERFELGRDDHSAEVRSPEELYGREQQRRELIAAFERVRGGATEMLLLTGSAGVGKSALVQEVQRELVRGGHFVSGKFDQYDRCVPYSALAAACGEIVRMHLTASSAGLEEWKQRVSKALGVNARVVADVVPELELVLGPQAPVLPLTPSEAQTRFERSFQRFIQASTTSGSPLVLFLDDLQWADSASLAVLRQILSSGDQLHLLVIGSYRDEEIDARHPVLLCLEAIKERVPVHRIQLGPLSREDVERLVGDALPFRSLAIEPLARLIHDKTSGNPFFVVQFLRRLEAEGLLVWEREEAEQAEQLAICKWLSRHRVTLLCFFEEGRELIETICNEQSAPMDVRAPLHTLKGNAATLDLNLLANLCHHAESAIDEGSFGPLVISGLTERWSALEATLHLLLGRDGRDRLEVPRTELRSIVTRLRAGASTDEAAELLERLELRPLSQPLAYLGERAIELSRRLDRVEPTIRVDDHGLSGEPEQGARCGRRWCI